MGIHISENLDWWPLIAFGCVLIFFFLLFAVILPAKDMSVLSTKAATFCEDKGLVLGFYRGTISCVVINETRVIESHPIFYVEGIEDWRFQGTWERLNDNR